MLMVLAVGLGAVSLGLRAWITITPPPPTPPPHPANTSDGDGDGGRGRVSVGLLSACYQPGRAAPGGAQGVCENLLHSEHATPGRLVTLCEMRIAGGPLVIQYPWYSCNTVPVVLLEYSTCGTFVIQYSCNTVPVALL